MVRSGLCAGSGSPDVPWFLGFLRRCVVSHVHMFCLVGFLRSVFRATPFSWRVGPPKSYAMHRMHRCTPQEGPFRSVWFTDQPQAPASVGEGVRVGAQGLGMLECPPG